MAARVLLLVLALLMAGVRAQEEEPVLRCYSCTWMSPADDKCIKDPDNASNKPVVDCRLGQNQCCWIERQDENENIGTPTSFARGCRPDCDPELVNGKVIKTPDFIHTTYVTYCNDDKCNNGEGNTDLGENDGGGLIIDGIQGIDGTAGLEVSLKSMAAALMVILAARNRG